MNIEPITGFPGYFVTETGRVLSERSGALRELKPLKRRGGYEKVRLYKGGRDNYKACFVHRLVAEAFVPNPHGLPVVNHKDENPQNNAAENLEWCTVAYNNSYGSAPDKKRRAMQEYFAKNPDAYERVAEQSRNRVWRSESREKIATALALPVMAYKDGRFVAFYNSAKEAAAATGAQRANICKALKGQRRTAGGYEWSYAACGGEIETGGANE